ncbi:MAG: hypothetical protein II781_01435 [Clostridia bacterium]|nr:hypothetical protein [Clostridia bacterium]
MDQRVYSLLKTWCDRYLSLQIRAPFDRDFRGAVLCPACGILHGRSSDMVYPLVYLWTVTGEDAYLQGAVDAVDWAERKMIMPATGLYRNDFASDWWGISAFAYLALADALRVGISRLPAAVADRWKTILRRLAAGIYTEFADPSFRPNVNYLFGGAAVMARASVLEKRDDYRLRALEWAEKALTYETEDGMIYGEGYHAEKRKSPRGFVPVDLGYNAEESIPLLFSAANDLDDARLRKAAVRMTDALLPFILPDGGLDNSWGARSEKWTYYGSRTSDGIQAALLQEPDNPVWREAAARNSALYEAYTLDGLLAGGAMHDDAGEPVCIHHTFTHAKVLAHMCESGLSFASGLARLPSDDFSGTAAYPSCGVYLAGSGDFRASLYASDYTADPRIQPLGGSLTLLWHRKTGPVLAATPNEYFPKEPQNMQLLRYGESVRCMTPRIVSGTYTSVYDPLFSFRANPDAPEFAAEGYLTGPDGGILCKETQDYARYRTAWRFTEAEVILTARQDAASGTLVLPVIAGSRDTVACAGNRIVITRPGGTVILTCDRPLFLPDGNERRFFNPVGGFQHVFVCADLPRDTETTVRIRVE